MLLAPERQLSANPLIYRKQTSDQSSHLGAGCNFQLESEENLNCYEFVMRCDRTLSSEII